jgi:hypothetical protein
MVHPTKVNTVKILLSALSLALFPAAALANPSSGISNSTVNTIDNSSGSSAVSENTNTNQVNITNVLQGGASGLSGASAKSSSSLYVSDYPSIIPPSPQITTYGCGIQSPKAAIVPALGARSFGFNGDRTEIYGQVSAVIPLGAGDNEKARELCLKRMQAEIDYYRAKTAATKPRVVEKVIYRDRPAAVVPVVPPVPPVQAPVPGLW